MFLPTVGGGERSVVRTGRPRECRGRPGWGSVWPSTRDAACEFAAAFMCDVARDQHVPSPSGGRGRARRPACSAWAAGRPARSDGLSRVAFGSVVIRRQGSPRALCGLIHAARLGLGYAYSPRLLAHDPPPTTVDVAGRPFALGTANVSDAALTAQAH
jgi:hypothetical protein